MSALYSRDILRLATSLTPYPPGRMWDVTVERRTPLCGSRVRLSLDFDGDGRIVDLGQELHACALGQAAAAVFETGARGRQSADLRRARDALCHFLNGASDDPGARPGDWPRNWPGLGVFAAARAFPARHAAILLPFDAAIEASAGR